MNTQTTHGLKDLTTNDWLTFGLNQVAYLRPAVIDGQSIFAIHGADGTQLALVATREIGVAAMIQHDLEPVALH